MEGAKLKMPDILKNMAKILAIAELAGPAAAKEMIENQANKIVVDDTEKAIKRISDAQKKELKKQQDESNSQVTDSAKPQDGSGSKVTDSEKSQEVSPKETDSDEATAKGNQSSAYEIQDTVEISQSANKSLEFETQIIQNPK